MKRTLFSLILLAGIFSLTFTGCKKYEDGPGLTFKSAKSRLSRVWHMDKSFTNGVEDQCDADCQKENQNSSMELKKDGTTIFINYDATTSTSLTTTGSWTLSSDKSLITITYSYTILGTTYNFSAIYTILRLTSKELWVKELQGTATWEAQFIAD